MKTLKLFLLILVMSQTIANSLWSLPEIYELGEILHSSRYDYEGGIAISFLSSETQNQESFLIDGDCKISSKHDAISVVTKAVSSHVNAYGDDEFDFNSAIKLLDKKLSTIEEIIICNGADESLYFTDKSSNFLFSFEYTQY